MTMRRGVFRLSVLLVLPLASLSSQRLGPPLDRPKLAGADTNDAHAYYDFGVSVFERDPETAAAAFYWAARIDPSWGEPLYARRASALMSNESLLKASVEGNRRTRESSVMRNLDSLQFRALMLSPFLYRQLDRTLFRAYLNTVRLTRSLGNGPARTPDASFDYQVETALRTSGEELRGWSAYGNGDLPNALSHYANALGNASDKASIRLDRARMFSMLSQSDSAIAEFGLALRELRERDKKDLVTFYNSKALAEFSIGDLHERSGNIPAAREAFGLALQEDLAFYPAHLRLGLLALTTRDTSTAMSELALAAQLAPAEPFVRYTNGYVLIGAKHYLEAVAELKKAIELEPVYALPHLWLGRLFEQLKQAPEALAAYQAFLDRAPASDPLRADAIERRDELKELVDAMKLNPS